MTAGRRWTDQVSLGVLAAFGLSVIGLGKHATAAALGPIRSIAETVALTGWLLESSDDDVRRARAYGLTLDAVDQYRKLARALGQSPQTRQLQKLKGLGLGLS